MQRFQPLLFQPEPTLAVQPLSDIVEETRAIYFPAIEDQIEVRIAAEDSLAYISNGFMGYRRHLIVFHPVLNHPGTPVEVLRFIAKHELTHLHRPPRVLDGVIENHPTEFWEHEGAVAPERDAAWAWVFNNLRPYVGRATGQIRVGLGWQALRDTRRTPYTPPLPFNEERCEHLCPGGGAQLLLPPDWVVRPRPLCARAGPTPGRK